LLFFLPASLLGILSYLGADFHFQNISKGIIDSRDVVYFLSICFIGLYGAHLALQEKH
jgi:ABC-2 type transport system permease protein